MMTLELASDDLLVPLYIVSIKELKQESDIMHNDVVCETKEEIFFPLCPFFFGGNH